MRVLLTGMGSRGDLQPLFALALALHAAGHDVVASGPPDFTTWAAELGVAFVPAGESVEAILKKYIDDVGANPIRVMWVMKKMIAQQVPVWFDRTLEAAAGAEVVVTAGQFVANSIAEKLRIPCFGVAYSPTLLPSSHHPPIMFPWHGLPRWANRAMWGFTGFMIERLLAMEP